MSPFPENVDVVVVGARVAGAATSMLLARAGLTVLAVDQARYGTDALSTHALMRAGVVQLQRWGLRSRLEDAGTPAIRETSFHFGREMVPLAIKPGHGIDALYAPRRTVLDRILVDAAVESGAIVRHRTRAVDLLRDERDAVRGVILEDADGRRAPVRASMVVGADGRHSRVAGWARAETYRLSLHSAATVYGHFEGVAGASYSWFYEPGATAGVIPTNDGKACVFVSVPAERFDDHFGRDVRGGFARTLRHAAPEAAGDILGRSVEGGLRVFRGTPGFLRHSYGDGWALVGDAGYFRDPVTAQGMTDALVHAELLARALTRGTRRALETYQATRDAISAGLFDVTESIASFRWDLPLVQSYCRLLAQEMKPALREIAGWEARDGAGRGSFIGIRAQAAPASRATLA